MKLSVIIPCYNEIDTIDTIIQQVLAVDFPLDRQIVVVDDYSTDGHATICNSCKPTRK